VLRQDLVDRFGIGVDGVGDLGRLLNLGRDRVGVLGFGLPAGDDEQGE
jgi:hypothetical protein